MEASAQIELARQVDFGRVAGHVGYLTRLSVGDDNATVSLIGVTNSVAFADDSDSVYAGGSLRLNVASNMSLDLSGTAFFGDEMEGFQAQAKIVSAF